MTATSNIHIGLSGWAASTVYTVGARVSNGSNAYQCITGGTSASSGGPTGTGSNITDNVAHWKYLSGIDYSSFGAWTSSIPTTLTQNIVGQLWNDGPITTSSGTPYLSLTGHTVGSFTITLTAAPGESFVDKIAGQTTALNFNSNNGVAFVLPSAGGSPAINYLYVTDSNVAITRLQFQDPNSASGSTILQSSGSSNFVIDSCLFDGYAQGGGACILGAGNGSAVIRNSVIIDRVPSGAAAGIYSFTTSATTCVVANCTAIALNSPSNVGGLFNSGTGSLTVTNSIVVGYPAGNCIAAPNGGTSSASYSLFSNSASGITFTNNTGNIFSASITNQFINASSDFRLKSGANAIDAGTTDTSDIPAAKDIAGTTRPSGTSWDIGAWEYVQAAPSISIPGVSSTAALGTISANIPSRNLASVVSYAALGNVVTQNVNVQSAMFVFQDGNIPKAAQFNNNFANCIDKTTATTQTMNAALTVGGALQASSIYTFGSLNVQGGQIVAMNLLTASGNYSMQNSDYMLVVAKTVAGPTTVILPNAPQAGRIYTIIDGSGTANSFPITIQTSQNVASYSSFSLTTPFASVNLVFSGLQWYAVSGIGSFDGTIRTMPGANRTSNIASGSASVAAGGYNIASGTNSIAAGGSNTAAGAQSIALGSNNVANNTNSVALGMWSTDRARAGQLTFASGRIAATGDAQWGLATLRGTALASGTKRLTADGNAASASNICNLGNNMAYGFGRIVVIAFDPINVHAAMWYVDNLLVMRGTTAATTALVGTPTITLAQASTALSALTSGSLAVTADTTNGGLNITLTNGSTVALDVVATLTSAEVS